MVPVLVFLSLLWFKGSAASSGHWSYEGDTGTAKWAGMFLTCGGSLQSPINIEAGNVKKEYWKPFNFKYYDSTPTRMRIKNNGHSAQVEMDAPNAPRISDGGFKGEYIFAQFHFHWGSESGQGSEHTIDGVRYPMELHLVHYKAEYGSLREAIKHPDGLAVLGVLFEIGATDSAAFDPIIRSLKNIKTAGAVSDVSARYPLSAYLPTERDNFFRYQGSLTTPTCNEVVVWTVFRKPVSISETQLQSFRSLLDEGGHNIVNNFRPPQQIRNRQIYISASGCPYESDDDFSYGKCISQWSNKFKMCTGKRQSPININRKNVIDFNFTPLNFMNYDMPPSLITVKNNGHTAQGNLKQAEDPTISGGGLPGIYTFAQYHFHWGSESSEGSEHTINNKRYPLELHLVHYRKIYGSLQTAVNKPDGLAVLSVLFRIQKNDNNDLKSLVESLEYIKNPGNKSSMHSMTPLSSFIPRDTRSFYRYEGSLTTPTCNEAVLWTVFENLLYISEKQLNAFRKLKGDEHHFISGNFRPVQHLHGRDILRSASGANYQQASSIVIILLPLLYFKMS